MKNDVRYGLYAVGALGLLGGGYLLWKRNAPAAHPPPPPPSPPVPTPRPPPAPAPPPSFYASEADRQQKIADATAAVQSGDPAKISAALEKLSPADRKKLEGMLPKF